MGSTSKAASVDSLAASQASEDPTTGGPQPPTGSEVPAVITGTTCCNTLLSTSQQSGSRGVRLWVLVFLIQFFLTKFVRFPNTQPSNKNRADSNAMNARSPAGPARQCIQRGLDVAVAVLELAAGPSKDLLQQRNEHNYNVGRNQINHSSTSSLAILKRILPSPRQR